MLYHNILIPYDKSDHARHAIEAALEIISDDPVAKATVLYVADTTEYDEVAFVAAAKMAGVQEVSGERMTRDMLVRDLNAIKAAVAERAAGRENQVVVKVAMGHPHQAIIKFAQENGCDLIVMGSRGINAIAGMIGSVSYAVIRESEVPVLVVK